MSKFSQLLKRLVGQDARSKSQLREVPAVATPEAPVVPRFRENSAHLARVSPKPELHSPLLSALANFERTSLRASRLVFHGCAKDARDTDLNAQRLYGTRKWFSSDAEYASDYAGVYGGEADGGVLWICKIAKDIPALIGRQENLHGVAPWQPHEFPGRFPDEFEGYAQAVLGTTGSVAFLAYWKDVGFKEILITSPDRAIEIFEIVKLPADIEKRKSLGRNLNDKYASQRAV